MEFQTIRKSYKKQIVIGALVICVIGGALTFNLTRAKYKITESIPLVRGNINYSVPDLRVVAIKTSEDGTNYTDVNDVPASGYILNTTNSICKLATTDAKDNNITIEYKDGKVNFLGVGNKNTRCYLYFDKKTSIDNASELLAKVQSEAKTTIPTSFASGTTTDEGVYAVSDPVYGETSYYWRGLVTNNYVKFADKCWRIVRINGDKTVRLIYDGSVCHMNGQSTTDSIAVSNVKYNASYNQSNYVGWTYTGTSQRALSGTASNAKTQLESWYSSNIMGTNAGKVADGKYCNDRNVRFGDTWSATGNTFYYAAYKRIITDHSPTLACPSGDIYTLNVGLITVDEAMYAGGTNKDQTSYYLYNGQNYWTMSPYQWYSNLSDAQVFSVRDDGYLNGTYSVYSSVHGLRPVINLRSDVTFSGGNGTLGNPYVVQ